MASELEKLRKSFRRSWMSYSECVGFLDEERLRRQNALVLDDRDPEPATEGWRDDQGPITFVGLVGMVELGFTERGVGRGDSILTITLGCALIGELLAAVFNEDRRAGGVFELSLDDQRQRKQVALRTLRNAVCHPGYLPAPVNDSSNIDKLIGLLDDEKNPFKEDLQRDRQQVTGAPVARWAVNATDELGRFELGKSIVARLERCGSSVSSQQRYGSSDGP